VALMPVSTRSGWKRTARASTPWLTGGRRRPSSPLIASCGYGKRSSPAVKAGLCRFRACNGGSLIGNLMESETGMGLTFKMVNHMHIPANHC